MFMDCDGYLKSLDKQAIDVMLHSERFFINPTRNQVSMQDILTVTDVSGEFNYARNWANTFVNDPVFTDVRDRSSANFLWFIKFEQSFTIEKTEKTLASPDSSTEESVVLNVSDYQHLKKMVNESLPESEDNIVYLPKTGAYISTSSSIW